MRIPLFPLHTVLFPGGPLPLRIFESRYLDMISRCMREDLPFGVLLIREGGETGPAATYDIGTLARISDWYQGSDGILGITAFGEHRFRLLGAERQHDGLQLGEVEILADVSSPQLPAGHEASVQILSNVLAQLGLLYEGLERRYEDTAWVAYRLVEILPVGLERKQACLESDDALQCLQDVECFLNA